MQGAIGRFFFQFGITCTVAVLLSLVISLTITPMLCSLLPDGAARQTPLSGTVGGLLGPIFTVIAVVHWAVDRWVLEPILLRPMNWSMERMTALYAATLRHAEAQVVRRAVRRCAGGGGAAVRLRRQRQAPRRPDGQEERRVQLKPVGQELVPSEDQSRFIVNVICPVGSNIDYVSEMLEKTEQVMADLRDPVTGEPLISTMFAAVSIRPGQLVSEGICFVRLVPIDQRSLTQNEVIADVRKKVAKIPGMRGVALDLSTQGFTPTRGYPVNFAVQGPDWETVTASPRRSRSA